MGTPIGWLLPLTIAAGSFFLYLNGAFFSSVSGLHVDFSINLTAAHALRDGDNPYGETALFERARALGSPTDLIYRQLFTSYIQPPTSALSITPLTYLSWREASRAYLVLNNLFLVAAVGLTLITVRPTLPKPWLAAGAAFVLMGFSQVYGSFALGQVDATITLLLAIGLWAHSRRRPALTGAAIALATAIKLIPGLLLVYFLWRAELRVVLWGIGAGLAIFLVSLAVAGSGPYQTYVGETLPALAKGSTQYANLSVTGAIARAEVHGLIDGLAPIYSLSELPSIAAARVWSALAALALVGGLGLALGRPGAGSRPQDQEAQPYVVEYYLVVAVGLLISSVTWEFYVVWLLPLFVAIFLAPARVLPRRPRLRLAAVAAFATAFVALNYPGDFYLFDVNGFFYHPGWVPGIWVEDRVQLYHRHLTAVPILRLVALLGLAVISAAVAVVLRREPGARNQERGAGN